jgi:riboflavin synthase
VFTGIVEEVGEVRVRDELPNAAQVRIAAAGVLADTKIGDSIAVNGICLTVTSHDEQSFTCDVMYETLRRIGPLEPGTRVNLERALAASGRLGGHIVQGHIDGTGTITGVEPSEHWQVITISAPDELTRYIVEKGSITVDGVSLTVAERTADGFTVSCIPTTLQHTTLGERGIGDIVNLEVDVLAKYVEQLLIGYRS